MKNEVLSAIEDRRSIRSYTADSVTDEELEALKAAAVQSPSAVNRQPYHFSFVRSKELLDEFRADAKVASGEENDMLRGAPMVCWIFADKQSMWAQVDSGIAVENLALAAHSMGLGSVILGMPRYVFNDEALAAKWEKKFNCSENMHFCIAIAIGKPAAGKGPHPVREGLIDVID